LEEAALRRARILVVDDEELNVKLLQEILQRAGFENLTTTSDSSAVVDLVARTTPDLVVLDLHMPAPNGFELMERLGAGRDDSWFQVLVLTADDTPEVKQRALSVGAADFLTKPFDPAEVLLRIENLLKIELLQLELRGENQRLEKNVYERTSELNAARIEVVERLAVAAEYRDDDTGEHAHRVGRTSALIAEEIGLREPDTALIRQAAPLHDLGKIGIPDSVLLKPGALTRAEFELMKTHAEIGASILSGSRSRMLQAGEEIARSHHERWDGGGYPAGLARESIPLQGRIVAVADVFDALTHERPYKQAWPVEDALAEIHRQSGRQFDPVVVEAFEHLDPEMLLGPIEVPVRARIGERNGALAQDAA
jgi:putative two-component system response regulator